VTNRNPQTKPRWLRAAIFPSSSLRDAAKNLSESSLRICLVVNELDRLLGTVTDGDIRRGLLRGLKLDGCVMEVMNRSPLVVPPGISQETLRQMMAINKIFQFPEVGANGEILDLHCIDEIENSKPLDALMIIMAGGKGTRLLPYTEACPKPMLQVKGKPMMAHILEHARSEGFSRIIISLNYLGDLVEGYFSDGRGFGLKIDYLRETRPLGTAGALSLLSQHPDNPFVVTNGDVLTDIRYADILNFHKRYEADATMAVRLYDWQHPFGVVEINGLDIIGFEEKPVARRYINAGVYVLSPSCLNYLIKDEQCDMPELFERVRQSGGRVIAYPMHEPWLDVGRHQDLVLANIDE